MCPTPCRYFTLSFTFTAQHDDDVVHFAHCFPFTYTDLQVYLQVCLTFILRLHTRSASCTHDLHPVLAHTICILYLHPRSAPCTRTHDLHPVFAHTIYILYLHPRSASCTRTQDLHPVFVPTICVLYLHPRIASCTCTHELHLAPTILIPQYAYFTHNLHLAAICILHLHPRFANLCTSAPSCTLT